MLKIFIIIIVALFVIFMGIHFIWRYRKKKRREALKRVKYENPRYIELEEEMEKIKRKRVEMEIEHPYQKLLAYKVKRDKAKKTGDEVGFAEYDDAIELILSKHKATEGQLARAYRAQLAAMSQRLVQIDMEQRRILLAAERG